MADYRGKVNAPDFPPGLDWLNTEHPLRLRDLHGKVVLLDFWTYCCINCMHILPELKLLEQKYRDELVVVGVHSAKFTTERETENIRQAILRYDIEHPVVNDHEMIMWKTYGVRAWPTVMMIDPAGKIVGSVSGENIFTTFDGLIDATIHAFDGEGKIDRRPLNLKLEREAEEDQPLLFPGKILAHEASQRLYIADSNHNRIVVLSMDDHSLIDLIGAGTIGIDDGSFDAATFNHPQGLAIIGDDLYIADTENHAIRRANLADSTVTTVAGTGAQAHQFNVGGPALQTPLNSPWDLVAHSDFLYIAMAGPHQIWRLNLETGEILPYAGSGREARTDGPLAQAALAQPSGITTDGTRLYVADSEISSIRSVDLDPLGKVETIVGGDLFEYGDVDGKGLKARLQHPLGVVWHEGVVYVADTYNNKIKKINPADRTIETFLGTGDAGLADGDRPFFDEPGGLSIANNTLYIADTNNHAIRAANLSTRRVWTLQIPDANDLVLAAAGLDATDEFEQLPQQEAGAGAIGLVLNITAPSGYKLTTESPSSITVKTTDRNVVSLPEGDHLSLELAGPTASVPLTAREGEASLIIEAFIYYCGTTEPLCFFQHERLNLPILIGADGKRTMNVKIRIKPAAEVAR